MRLGTRGSALALAQAQLVAEMLGSDVEVVPVVTRGDRESAGVDDAAGEASGDGPAGAPPPGEDKSRWVSELERALLDGAIDAAVHSAKDVPGEVAEGLLLVAAPPRAAAEDVLCGAATLAALGPGARIGTSSVRRVAQLRAARADVEVLALHGNVDTRLRRLDAGDFDAIVLARAGLDRLGRGEEAGGALDFVPAPGQGTLALQARAADEATRERLTTISDERALACLLAERALAAALGAGCDTPLGAHAKIEGETMLLRAWIGLPDGSEWVADALSSAAEEPQALGREVAQRLQAAGGEELLRRA
ncbi:MAG TPA: hydroxymethylbilane synthase [Solirubrobacteraceae bacterium]|nr:hydroxymethylbilane synthase [Solirubrobacteraceae bacterium]